MYSIALAFLAALSVAPSQAPASQTPATPPQTPPVAKPAETPESKAWDAANSLKTKSDYAKAAAGFESFHDAFPESSRASLALVEAGVCWFSVGRGLQNLHRATPDSTADFDKAMKLFERVTTEYPKDPAASRAQYMKGSTYAFSGELAQAESAYSAVVASYAADRNYVGKAIERRSAVRRSLFKTTDALADLELYIKDYATGDLVTSAKTTLGIARTLDKPAIPWVAESWVQGDPVTLDSIAGRVIALYFFASWCPHCAEELPFILDLERRYTPKGLKFVGVVNHSQKQTADSVRQYLKDKGIPFCVLMDGGPTNSAYGLSTIPHLVLIDREGKIRWRDNPSNLADWTIDSMLNGTLDAKPAKSDVKQPDGK